MSMPAGRVYVYQDRCPEGTAKLAGALAKAVPNYSPLTRNCVSHYARKGPDGKPVPDYADLAQCHKSAAKALSDQGLVVVQTVTLMESDMVLVTQLLHSSGEWIQSTLPLKAPPNEPQKLAAAITYARRTAYCAMVGLAADDDDGGEAATTAAAAAVAGDDDRVERLLAAKVREAKTRGDRNAALERAQRGAAEGKLSLDALARISQLVTDANAKEAAKQPHKREPSEVTA